MGREDRLVSLVCLVSLVEPERPDEPDQPSPVSPVPRVSLDYPASNCGKTISAQRNFTDLHVWNTGRTPRRMLKKAVSKAAGESKPEAYPLGYVEDFDEPRTKLADFFSILL
jgi:hypothetical protein